MSMTSKVNPTLRAQIIALLAGGVQRTNNNLGIYTSYSLRGVQEATQKMTKEGALVATISNGKTYYSIPEQKLLTAGAAA